MKSGQTPVNVTLQTPPAQTDPTPPENGRPKSKWRRLRAHWRAFASKVPKPIKILIATVIGTLLILIGIPLSLPGIPGPGTALILAGLAVLATEFIWAKHLLEKIKSYWHWFKPKYVNPLIVRFRRWRGNDEVK